MPSASKAMVFRASKTAPTTPSTRCGIPGVNARRMDTLCSCVFPSPACISRRPIQARRGPGALSCCGISPTPTSQAFWPQIKHSIAGRLTQDMAAEGFSDIERGKNLQLEPYLLGRNLRQLNTIDPDRSLFSGQASPGLRRAGREVHSAQQPDSRYHGQPRFQPGRHR